MVDNQDTKLALRTALLNSGVMPGGDIEWEGLDFNPDGKAIWLREVPFNIDETNITACLDNKEGMYVWQIFTPAGLGSDDIDRMALNIAALYAPGTILSHGGVQCFVHYSQLGDLQRDEKWLWKNLEIFYRASYIAQGGIVIP